MTHQPNSPASRAEQAAPSVVYGALPNEVTRRLWNILSFYSNVTSYDAPRVGGVLAGCPRGGAPTPYELTWQAREGLALLMEAHGKKAEKWMRAAPSAATAAREQEAVTVTDAMVDAYLEANTAYWQRTDQIPPSPSRWRAGTPREATREGLIAALALCQEAPVAPRAPAQAEPAAVVPDGWKFDVTTSDGRVWLTVKTPHGASAALSTAQKDGNGSETIAAQVLLYLRDMLAAAPQPPAAAPEPLFWYRPCRDGLYEGPHHNNSVGGKMLRDEKPEEWRPLYTHPTPQLGEQAELKRLADCCPELNERNYDQGDVEELNAWAVEVAQCIDRALASGSQQAAPEPAKSPSGQPLDDDVLGALDLRAEQFRTEGGAIIANKLRAALLHPHEYLPPEHWLCADRPQPAAVQGQVCPNHSNKEPYGCVTTHSVTGQQFFYRHPEPPYLDNASECVSVYTYPAPVVAHDAEDALRLDFLNQPGIELGEDNDPEVEQGKRWVVDRCQGSRNDREWVELGRGATPREAIDAAIANQSKNGGGI